MNAIVIETINDDGTEWGVSIGSHNPESYEYQVCRSKQHAYALKALLENLKCPYCGHTDIIEPTEKQPHFTCDKCAKDFTFHRLATSALDAAGGE